MFLLCWKQHHILLLHILLQWVICVSSHLWVPHHWTTGPLDVSYLDPSHSCLDIFVLITFRCTCVFCCCVNFRAVIFRKCMYPIFLTVSLPKNQVSSGIHGLEHSFLWCLTSNGEYLCLQTCIGYWWVTISSDDHHRPVLISCPLKLICRCTGAWCCTLLWCQHFSQICGPVP